MKFNIDKIQGAEYWHGSNFLFRVGIKKVSTDLDDKFIFFMDSGGDTAPPEIKTFTDRVMNQLTLLNNPIKSLGIKSTA